METSLTITLVDGYCKNFGKGAFFIGEENYYPKLSEDFNYEDFSVSFSAYYINEDGVLTKDETKIQEVEKENQLKLLRQQREFECFPVINRGKLWYDNLSPSQLDELQTWYQAWLDVTETLQIPDAPAWINEQ